MESEYTKKEQINNKANSNSNDESLSDEEYDSESMMDEE